LAFDDKAMKPWAKVILGILGSLLLLFALCVATLWFMFAPENWSKRKARFETAEATGMTLVGAIQTYSVENGAPPENLQALVPQYLARIPDTGLRDYPAFEYEVFTNSKMSLAWYDLGSRGGKPIAGLWVYFEGKPEHAILALTLDQHERVVDARVDRMPQEYDKIDFNAEKWNQRDSRIEMAESLPNHVTLKGATLSELRSSLGEPTGTSTLRNAPWELRIKCSNGVVNWDVFFYWPTEEYPKQIYGGRTELIGRWAYVHE